MKMHSHLMHMRNPVRLERPEIEPFLTRLIGAGPGPCLVVDPATDTVRAANAPAAELFGADTLQGLRFSHLHPGSLPSLIVFAEEVAEYGQAWTRDLKGRHCDGTELGLEYEGRALDAAGEPLIAFHAHDLAERARRNAKPMRRHMPMAVCWSGGASRAFFVRQSVSAS